MNIFEIIKVIADILIAFFTATLVWATLVLAKHTEIMSKRDAERRRVEDIEKCVLLAESIVRLDNKEFGDWARGELLSKSIHPFNKLLTLSKYFHNKGLKIRLEYVITILTYDLRSGNSSIYTNQAFNDTLNKLRSELIDEIRELQKDL